MAKYKYEWNQKRLQKIIGEGRGKGCNKEYKPWITIHDFPSDGFSNRVPGWKSKRVCHFMSLNELYFFYFLEWSDIVIDIREQFPLIEYEETIRIAESLHIRHPFDNESNTPYVLTSDFMITLKTEKGEIDVIKTVKPLCELAKSRVIEKFEIERRYWIERDVKWGIISEKNIPRQIVKNIDWIYSSYHLEPTNELSVEELLCIGETLKYRLHQKCISIRKVTNTLDKELNVEEGTSLYVFKHLIARKEIKVNIEKQLNAAMLTDDIREIKMVESRVMTG